MMIPLWVVCLLVAGAYLVGIWTERRVAQDRALYEEWAKRREAETLKAKVMARALQWEAENPEAFVGMAPARVPDAEAEFSAGVVSDTIGI